MTSIWNEDIDGMESEHLEIKKILESNLPDEDEEELEFDEGLIECTCDICPEECLLHNELDLI